MEDFTSRPDLASRAFGGGVVAATDEFFAAADHLVLPTPPVFAPRTFDHKGQVYDGWESRRRRSPGARPRRVARAGRGADLAQRPPAPLYVGNDARVADVWRAPAGSPRTGRRPSGEADHRPGSVCIAEWPRPAGVLSLPAAPRHPGRGRQLAVDRHRRQDVSCPLAP